MHSFFRNILVLCLALSAAGFALDRNAFTFTKYDLEVRIDPDGAAIAARGKVTLRNDSDTPQNNVVLQISSSLDWRMIELNGAPLQYLSVAQTTDIDHTGKVMEAVVTLPAPIAPKGSVVLDIGYSGEIPQDATRLTRMDVPDEMAKATEWDRISPGFTALRGIGHVAWYPIAVDPANLSQDTLFSTISRWQVRQAQTSMNANFCWITDEDHSYTVVANGTFEKMGAGANPGEGNRSGCTSFAFTNLQQTVPTFSIAPFGMLTRPAISVYYLDGHEDQASSFALAAEKVQPQIESWLGKTTEKVQLIQLPEGNDAPFDSGAMLFTPLRTSDATQIEVTVAHQMAHAAFHTPRLWISEGLANFASFLMREQTDGRRAALDYLGSNLPVLIAAEKQDTAKAKPSSNADAQSLISTDDEVYYRVKAMYVWSMLRDLIGDQALRSVLKNYRAVDDKDPAYLQRLVAAQDKRDLSWFFDDWVYHDRGLPELKIESAVPRQTVNDSYLVAVTVENDGGAGVDIPITVRSAGGEQTERILVPAHQKATTRLAVAGKPIDVAINNGTVPEVESSDDHLDLK